MKIFIMPRLTVSLDDNAEYIEKKSGDEGEHESKSPVMRNCIQARKEQSDLRNEIERLRDRLDSREERIDELEEQLSRRSKIEEKVDTLAKREKESNAPFIVKWVRWWRERD